MNYVFGKQLQELSEGSISLPAYQGLATLSPWPLTQARILRFQRQSKFWRPRWYIPNLGVFQRRLGGGIALICELCIGSKKIVTYNLHLESRGDDDLRLRQLSETLADAARNMQSIAILGGDFNLESGNAKADSAVRMAGFSDAVHMPTCQAQ